MALKIHKGDNLAFLRRQPDAFVDLIYIDPPFDTGRAQKRDRSHADGEERVRDPSLGYRDSFDDCAAFIEPRMRVARRVLKPSDVWRHGIVGTNSREKTGYATQKPRAIIDRIVKVHSNPGDLPMDFFAGSGTLGESAAAPGRDCILVDSNPAAIDVMRRRFAQTETDWI